jgi:hypothetical protein
MRYLIRLHERLLDVEDTRPRTELKSFQFNEKQTQKRRKVQGLSGKSRYRLIQFLATIGRDDPGFFVTLTYWRFTDDWAEWKRHLRAFVESLRRFADGVCGVWRLEFQERGAPHYHLLLWFDEPVDRGSLDAHCREAWLRIIDQDAPETRAYAVTVDPIMDMRSSAFYLSVYQSKDKNDRKDIQTGRLWGCIGRERLQTEPFREMEMDERQMLQLRRFVRRLFRNTHRRTFRRSNYYKWLQVADGSFKSFGPLPQWYRILEYITKSYPKNEYSQSPTTRIHRGDPF